MSSIYAVVGKKTKIYQDPQLDLSLPTTPLDADQTEATNLKPLPSVYCTPALLAKEEEPLVLTHQDVEEVSSTSQIINDFN